VGDQQVPSLPVIARELWCVCSPIYRSVSVYFIAEFNFTVSYLKLYIYIICIKETEIMNSNKEIYSVLKFTAVCHVIVLIFAVLQRY